MFHFGANSSGLVWVIKDFAGCFFLEPKLLSISCCSLHQIFLSLEQNIFYPPSDSRDIYDIAVISFNLAVHLSNLTFMTNNFI